MDEHATQQTRRPGEDIRVSLTALTNTDGGKENIVFLNPVDALPIQSCAYVDSYVYFSSFFASRSRSYDTKPATRFKL